MKEHAQPSRLDTLPRRILNLMVSQKVFTHTDAQGTVWRLVNATGCCESRTDAQKYEGKYVLCSRKKTESAGSRPFIHWACCVEFQAMADTPDGAGPRRTS